jgi:peptide/nickel transport system permease protein
MATYILRRLGSILVIMFLASIIIFSITQFLPGDVAQLVLGQFATEEAIANLREEYGLNNPFYIQYLDWAVNFVQGDWGNSLVSRMPVFPMVMSRLRNSAMLAVVVLVFYVPLGIFFGVLAALKRDKWPDQVITTVSMVFVALPVFVISLLLIPLFCHSGDAKRGK